MKVLNVKLIPKALTPYHRIFKSITELKRHILETNERPIKINRVKIDVNKMEGI